MFFTKSFVTVLAVVSSAFATISINSPSSNDYWVQFTSNIITWGYAQGDANPIDITVTNPNTTYLNGPFSIARNVDLSNGSFTVTNVTLIVAPGYVVNFVNGSNQSQIYASSGTFDVKVPGTAAANVSTAAPSPTGTSPSGTGNGTATGTGATGTNTKSAAMRSLGDGSSPLPLIFSGMMVLVGAAITL